MHLVLALIALQGLSGAAPAQQDTLLPPADSAAMATAYRDASARELVRRARGQQDAVDASVFHYTATSHQLISVGVRALRRDRILYRREVASEVEWWRDRPGRVEVRGAREVIPIAISGVQVPEDLDGWAREFVPRPGDERLWVNPTGGGFAWHPLADGAEALYQYASGDTTTVRLPDGREIRLAELRVTPRERDIRVIAGSFWIELDGYGVVQAVFRPARDFDLERDLPTLDPGSDDAAEVPGFLKPVRFDTRYITVEYGLWEMRWWMPRLMGFEGYVQLGGVRMPIRMEIAYSDYTVEADRHGLPGLPPLYRQLAGTGDDGEPREYRPPIRVVVPADSAALLESDWLEGSIFRDGETLISESELERLADRLGDLPAPPWEAHRPRLTPPWTLGQGLLRYNRVEGLSAGVRMDWDLTRARVDATARIGAADLAPRAELGITLPGLRRSWRAAAYHRLEPANHRLRPLGMGNSLTALLFGRDDGMYFGATGLEARVEPTGGGGWELRLYAERQRSVEVETDFSLAHAAGGDPFRPNIDAVDADQMGAQGRLRWVRGLDPTGYRVGAELELAAETGTFTFARPGLTLTAGAPLPAGLLGAVELGAGTTVHADTGAAAVPVQGLWFLGGPATLRGFAGGALTGQDYLRARTEIATRFPAARVALFSDAAWAGTFDGWDRDDVALSAGIGASFLDGLLRTDLARTIQPVEQWRLELYLDAVL